MTLAVILFLVSATFLAFVAVSFYLRDKRRFERRRRRLFAPIERRRRGRRQPRGLGQNLAWALREVMERFTQPKDLPKPRRRTR